MSRKPHKDHTDETSTEAAATATEATMPSDEKVNDETVVTDPMEALKQQLTEMNNRYLRTLAEYDNYRKRTARELTEARLNSKFNTVGEFLAVFDYFSMAMDHADAPGAGLEVIRQGMQMIFTQYKGLLDNLGVVAIDATGKVFDPAEHEAISQEASDEIPKGSVIRQWKCGYKAGERLIRPATVVVSSGSEVVTDDNEDTDAEPQD